MLCQLSNRGNRCAHVTPVAAKVIRAGHVHQADISYTSLEAAADRDYRIALYLLVHLIYLSRSECVVYQVTYILHVHSLLPFVPSPFVECS